MIEQANGENLTGYKKKSFALPYNGGEIWFEHLDGIYDHENLVVKKLEYDIHYFSKPSATSYICFVFNETVVTDKIIVAVEKSILESSKCFMKIAFTGLDRKNKHKLNRGLKGKGFAVGFFIGLEDAKE